MVKSLFFGLLVTLTAAGASADGDVCSKFGPLSKYQPAEAYCSTSYGSSPCTVTVSGTATETTTVATVTAFTVTSTDASTITASTTTTDTITDSNTVTTTVTVTDTTTTGTTTTYTGSTSPIPKFRKRNIRAQRAKRAPVCRPVGSTTSSAGWAAVTTPDSLSSLYSSLTAASPVYASSICACIEASQTGWVPQAACVTSTVGASATVTSSVTYTVGATATVTVTGSVVTITSIITATASTTATTTVTLTTTTTQSVEATETGAYPPGTTMQQTAPDGLVFTVVYGEVLTGYTGTAVISPGADSENACLDACDADSQCGAFSFDGTTCTLIENYGADGTGVDGAADSAYGTLPA